MLAMQTENSFRQVTVYLKVLNPVASYSTYLQLPFLEAIPICNPRTRHAMGTRDPFNMEENKFV
jgi:hypothetical protein